MVTARWLGAAGVELLRGDDIILIDPYLSRSRKFEVFFTHLKPKKPHIRAYLTGIQGTVRAVIVGHTHFDHALDIPELAGTFTCTVYGSRSMKTLLSLSGLPSLGRVCTPHESIALFEEARLTMLPSRHGLVFLGRVPYRGEIDPGLPVPLRAHQYRLGDMMMPVTRFGDITFVHAGSANWIESEVDIHSCDVLFMCVPGWKKSPSYTREFLDRLRPSVIIPFHYDDFTTELRRGTEPPVLPFVDRKGFERSIRSTLPRVEVLWLKPYLPARF
ncbi:MAG TPA: MBL fold metallo-hydrolase [Deltaproteobacteria bacterium]|nr:MBL fold metallo-hydrolase [Deltaproteobacteria bacterium]